MSSFNISTRYANAFMGFAESKNSLEQASDDMLMLESALSKSKELRVILKSPVINKDKKESILKEIFSKIVDPTTIEFLLFVNNKNRGELLFDIAKRYNEIRNIKMNRVKAEVIGSVDFSDEQKNIMGQKLKELSQKDIIPSFKKDDSLIGGFTVKINDTVIDASVKQQLIKLRKSLV